MSSAVELRGGRAETSGVPAVRPLLLTLVVLALPAVAPASAVAWHPHDDPPAWSDPGADLPDEQAADDGLAPDDDPAAAADPSEAPVGATGLTGPGGADDPALDPVLPALPLVTTATVPGRVARLRTDGKAAIPRGAPKRIRAVIAAANQIVGKPYKWGGGHAKLVDRGYDCSGAVSYALVRAGLLGGVQVSGTLARWAVGGEGRWLTVNANRGHVYLEVAGLRLDTSAVGGGDRRGGVRWREVIGRRPGFHARHVLGL